MALLAAVNPSTDVHPALPRLLNRLSAEQRTLQALDRYYTGSQPLSFLAPEIQRAVQNRLRSLVINWPRLVVNSLEERLDVEGFRMAADQPADDSLWAIWQANDLDEYSQMAHVDALVHGRSFAIVWPNPANPAIPRISVESSEQMTVEFEPGTMTVSAAAKHWAQDDMAYATLYLSDSIERYVAPAPGPGAVRTAVDSFAWELREDPIPHNLGIVPVVPIINRPRLTHPHGESELTDVLPLVDAINKLATDMMVSAEFHAMPRRWAVGIDLGDGEGSEARAREILKQKWTDAAPGRVWLSDDPNSKMGQFTEASLDNFVHGIEMLAAQLAAITALPPHYVGLMSQANPASADAIRSSEASLSHRARRKFRPFGGSWERVMRLAMLVRDGNVPTQALSMETIWRDPETPTVAQKVDAAVKLDGVGMPFRQTMEDLGYTPVQIERAIRMRTTDALADVRAQLEDVDTIVKTYGLSRAGALAVVGLDIAAQVESRVEAHQPGPGVTDNAEFTAEQSVGDVRVVGGPGKPAPPAKPPVVVPPHP